MDEDKTVGVREGDILAGKYRIDKILGAGGMGVVVAAHHLQLDDKLAIKFLLPGMLNSKEAIARFSREARAAVRIKSEHVARVSDVGTLDNGAPYMVMEYLDGTDLSGWVKKQGTLPVEQAIEFVLQACEAIAEAHSLGIVHRDLKPANLFVIRRPDGMLSVKVLDFGISKVTGVGGSAPGASMTQTAALMGSPLYMSPEQMQSAKDAETRSDIWALGIILYELLTGETPFAAETMPELVLKVMSAPVPPIRTRRPDVPLGLESTILKCLEKDRRNRYESIGELAVALVQFGPKRSRASVERISGVLRGAGLSASALALPPSSDGASPAAAGTGAPFSRTTPETSGSRRALFGGAIAAIVIVGTLAITRPWSTTGQSVAASAEPLTSSSATTEVRDPLPKAESAKPPDPQPVIEPSGSSTGQPTSGPVPSASATVRPPGQRPPPRPAATTRPPDKKANCNPNFYFDAQGDKHFKPECF